MDNLIYVPHFDIAAAALTLVLLILHQFRRSYPTRASYAYRTMLYLLLIASVSDFLSSYTITYAGNTPPWLNYTINILYLYSLNMIAAVFFLYVHYTTTQYRISLFSRIYAVLTIVVESALIFSTPYRHLIIYLDELGQYRQGPLFIYLYCLSAISCLLALFRIARCRRDFNRGQVTIFVSFVFVMFLVISFQYLFPRYLLTPFVASILILLIYIIMENPSTYMYKNTYCYNENALYNAVGRRLAKDNPFSVVVVGTENASLFSHLLSANSLARSTEHLIDTMHLLFGQSDVFYLHNNHFAVITTHDPKWVIEPANDRLRETLIFDETEIAFIPYFLVFDCPKIVKSTAVLRDMLEYSIQQHEQKGGESVTVLTAEDVAGHEREQRVLHSVREAIRLNRFSVYYQPIMNAETGRYIAAEALVRLNDPELGMIPPDEFIITAERNGLILQIGEIVLEEACRFFREAQLHRFNIAFIDINLSAMQCMQPDLETRVMNILRRHKLDPQYINLEITETAAAANKSMMLENMNRLAQRGIAFSIDDFGTGYSNADYLTSLPIRMVKIDKSLLWKAMDDKRSMVVLLNTCNMVRQLGLHCVCEGVESQTMVSVLKTSGVNYYQGFLFARPMPGDEFLEFIRRH